MHQIPWLNHELWFPPLEQALEEPAGLLAAGGDLSPERLLHAYQHGIFPWYEGEQPILWWSPSPRTLIYPDKIHISRSLRKTLRQRRYHVSCNQDFAAVIQICADKRAEGTWITEEMIQAYMQLHQLGHAHSIEVWACDADNKTLIGGLYGVSIGRIFFGESMFSLRRDTSKIALCYLAKQLSLWDFVAIDGQMSSAHLSSLGAEEVSMFEWKKLLQATNSPAPNWNNALKEDFCFSP